MSIDPTSGFEIFNPISGRNPPYPSPVNNLRLPGTSRPTNSWFQNAVTNTVDDNNRFANVTPWYWKIFYNAWRFSLSHANRTVFVNTTTNGNLQQIETQPVDDIVVSIAGGDTHPMFLTALDDYTAKFAAEDDKFVGLPSRGSPFATFQSNSNDINVNFAAFGVTSVAGVTGVAGAYIINTQRDRTTNTNTGFDDVGALNKTMTRLSFYDGPQSLNQGVTATLSYLPGVNYNEQTKEGTPPQPAQLVINTLGTQTTFMWTAGVNTQSGLFTFNPPGSGTGMMLSPTTILIRYTIPGLTGNYSVVVNADWNLLPQTITAIYSRTVPYRWLLYGPSMIMQSGSQIAIPNYTGVLQLAAINSDAELTTYLRYLGTYLTAGVAANFQTNGSFSINYSRVGSNQLLLLPNHWSSFNLTGLTPVAGMPKVQNIIYGDLTYYTVSNDRVTLTSRSFTLPPIVNLSNWTASQRASLTMQVNADAAFLAPPVRNFIPSSDPYSFGQIAAAVGRLFLFAKELGIPTTGTGPVAAAVTTLKQYLTDWLANKNVTQLSRTPACNCAGCPDPTTIFHLQRENRWGGIIVPADYLNSVNASCYTLGSFGNSFYNDHHFHWGYILYALACLEYIGQGLAAQYPRQITALIRDLVNPSSDTFAWKTRYKDWFAGHSWATGNTTEVARQQESCSEAINGYYGAYLMAERLGLNDLQACAAACLNLEIQACQNYYYLLAPGSKLGLMNQVHGIGIIFNNSKQFTLDWGMQPDSFPGRALGIYGIQTIPFTDIARIQIPSSWASLLSAPTPDVGLAYAITPSLVAGLCDSTYTPIPVYDTRWKADDTFNVEREGTFWGFVGLKMLLFGSGIDNLTAQNAYNDSVMKQNRFMSPTGDYFPIVKQFDTFSNTLYWIISTGRWSSAGTGTIVVNSPASGMTASGMTASIMTQLSGSTVDACAPFPILSPLQLLQSSPLRNQGLVQVPILRVKICFNEEETNPILAHFQIQDDRLYYKEKPLKPLVDRSGCCVDEDLDGCLIHGVCPENVKTTQLQTDLDITTMIAATGTTLYEKTHNLGDGVSASDLATYAYFKLILARIIYGTFDLKYLAQSYTLQLFEAAGASRFCPYVEYLFREQLIFYDRYFVE